jgi:hypothetical protein
MPMMRLAPAVLVVIAVMLASSGVRAQPSDADRATALAMLQAGIDAAQDGDWESARVAFGRAYTLVESTRVLMNLAGAQRHCGRLIEARASYERWLVDATDRDASYRPTVETALAEMETEMPHVVVLVRNARDGDYVQLDGTTINVAESTQADPGPHTVTLMRGDQTLASEPIDLVIGDHQEVTLAPPSFAAVDPALGAPPRTVAPLVTPRTNDDITQSPWFWVGVGGGAVVLLGVIIGVAVGASSGGDTSPADMGTLGPFRL